MMNEVEVKFQREDRAGVVAAGSYLVDAARRLGVKFEEHCVPAEGEHYCRMSVGDGRELLSEPTAIEKGLIKEAELRGGTRLACQTRLEQPGEVVVVTEEKKPASADAKEETKPEEVAEEYRKSFADLPLETKMSQLVQLEAMALTDTLSYIANAPYTVADKFMGVLADLGFRKEQRTKEETRPVEHRAAEPEQNGDLDTPIPAEEVVDAEPVNSESNEPANKGD